MRRGYDLAFHNFVGKQSKCPAGVAGRRLRAGQGNQLGLTLAIEDRLNRRRLAFLACKYRIQPFVDEFRTYPRYHRNVGIERLAYFFIRPACPLLGLIRFQQDTRLQNDLRRGPTLGNLCLQALALLTAQLYNESLVRHDHCPLSVRPDINPLATTSPSSLAGHAIRLRRASTDRQAIW